MWIVLWTTVEKQAGPRAPEEGSTAATSTVPLHSAFWIWKGITEQSNRGRTLSSPPHFLNSFQLSFQIQKAESTWNHHHHHPVRLGQVIPMSKDPQRVTQSRWGEETKPSKFFLISRWLLVQQLGTYCVEGIESSVIPGGCNTPIFCGSSITHPCKCCHAPLKVKKIHYNVLKCNNKQTKKSANS